MLISLLLEYDLSDTMSGDKWYLYMFINARHATASTCTPNNKIRQYLIQGKHHTSIPPCLYQLEHTI